MKKLEKVKIYANQNQRSARIFQILVEELKEYSFQLVEEDPDLAIAIGGDGAFLRMLKERCFDEQCLYVGINTGTLGFLQEICPDDIHALVVAISKGQYRIEQLGVQETKIFDKEQVHSFFSLNEIVLREKDLNTLKVDLYIDHGSLGSYVGDGLLISTSTGSTAYNLSYGGSIVHHQLHSLQITPIAPLNSRSYRSLQNSIVLPEKSIVTILPKEKSVPLIVSIDGENQTFLEVERVETTIQKKKISCLRLHNYNFYQRIHEKFLKND